MFWIFLQPGDGRCRGNSKTQSAQRMAQSAKIFPVWVGRYAFCALRL
jgi:hypothetical protein